MKRKGPHEMWRWMLSIACAAAVACLQPISAASHDKVVECGCSWSTYEGCGVSSQQLLESLAKSKIDDMCENTNQKGNASLIAPELERMPDDKERARSRTEHECKLRAKIREHVPELRKCLSLTNAECHYDANSHCEFGAQQQGKCGISEEQLVSELVGKENLDHPLAKFIVNSDKCRERGERSCEADGLCAYSQRFKVCDMKEIDFYIGLLEHPDMTMLLHRMRLGSYCRAVHERVDVCIQDICHFEYGVCTMNFSNPELHPSLDQIVNITCSLMKDKCQEPCQKKGDECVAPSPLPPRLLRSHLSHKDYRVLGVMIQLNAATYWNEGICNSMDTNESQCLKSKPVCEHLHSVPVNHSNRSNDTRWNMGVGLDGLLGQVVAAATSGQIEERMEAYLAEHPDTLEKLAEGLKAGWAKFADHEEKRRKKKAKHSGDRMHVVPGLLIAAGCVLAALAAGALATSICSGRIVRGGDARLLAAEETMTEYDATPVGVPVSRAGNKRGEV